MSDYNKMPNPDRYITGNYGEDQFKGMKETDLELLAKEMFNAWRNKHKELYPDLYKPSEDSYAAPEVTGKWLPPEWDDLNENIKQCWLAAAKYAIDEYIS